MLLIISFWCYFHQIIYIVYIHCLSYYFIYTLRCQYSSWNWIYLSSLTRVLISIFVSCFEVPIQLKLLIYSHWHIYFFYIFVVVICFVDYFISNCKYLLNIYLNQFNYFSWFVFSIFIITYLIFEKCAFYFLTLTVRLYYKCYSCKKK